MTEAEWNRCTRPAAMLSSLRGKLSDRKLRLFAGACLRRVWHLLADDALRRAIEETEQAADETGNVSAETLRWWQRLYVVPAFSTMIGVGGGDVYDGVAWILVHAAHTHAEGQAASWREAHAEADPVWRSHVSKLRSAAAREEEAAAQSALLRDVAGMPPRRMSLEPSLLQWNGGLVIRLAQAAYDERFLPEGTLDPSRLAVLADALEEAGCTAAEPLDHLRGQGPHVRGCHVVDAILGKA